MTSSPSSEALKCAATVVPPLRDTSAPARAPSANWPPVGCPAGWRLMFMASFRHSPCVRGGKLRRCRLSLVAGSASAGVGQMHEALRADRVYSLHFPCACLGSLLGRFLCGRGGSAEGVFLAVAHGSGQRLGD